MKPNPDQSPPTSPDLNRIEPGPASNSALAPQDEPHELWQRLDLERRLLEVAIDRGDYDHLPVDPATLHLLQARLCQRFAPHLTGWRCVDPGLRQLLLPRPHSLYPRVVKHMAAASERIARDCGHGRESLIDALAFLEGGLLALHPFNNLCEPSIRLLMRLQLRRLGRPGVALDRDTTPLYLQAISDGRLGRWAWLVPVWRLRLDWSSGPLRG